MNYKDIETLNNLLRYSIGRFDANCCVYVGRMIDKAKEEAQIELLEEIQRDFNDLNEGNYQLPSQKELISNGCPVDVAEEVAEEQGYINHFTKIENKYLEL